MQSFYQPSGNNLAANIFFMCSKDGDKESKFFCLINKELEKPRKITSITDFHYLNYLIDTELKTIFENGTEGRTFTFNIHLMGKWGAREMDCVFDSLTPYSLHLQQIGFDCRTLQTLTHFQKGLDFEKNSMIQSKSGPLKFVQ